MDGMGCFMGTTNHGNTGTFIFRGSLCLVFESLRPFFFLMERGAPAVFRIEDMMQRLDVFFSCTFQVEIRKFEIEAIAR